MKIQRILNRLAFLTILIVCFAGQFPGQTQTKPKPAAKAIPNLIINAIDGKEWSLYENLGGIVALNFGATWCGPGRTEIPMLVKVFDEYEKRGLKIVGIRGRY